MLISILSKLCSCIPANPLRLFGSQLLLAAVIFGLFVANPVSAQVEEEAPLPANAREKLEAMKMGYLTRKLNLSVEEAQEFWPIHNKLENESEKLKKEARKIYQQANNLSSLSDREVEQLVQQFLALEEQKHQLVQRTYKQLSQVLPNRKIILYYRAKREFKSQLLRMLRERRNGAGGAAQQPQYRD